MVPPPPPPDALQPWVKQWNLEPEGDPIVTATARLLPCRYEGQPAILKVASEPEEQAGWVLMEWWNADGAARVMAHARENALLLERATGSGSLAQMARRGRDPEATLILCQTLAHLHHARTPPAPAGLIDLADWFSELWPMARQDERLATAAMTARRLLADQQQVIPLHGDIHHDNVLDFGPRGWLAIDPKRLLGDRAFDYANIFTNPDLSDPLRPVAVHPGIFDRRLEIVVRQSGLDPQRMLDWIIAWTGLSAAWFLNDNDPLAEIDLRVMQLALNARST